MAAEPSLAERLAAALRRVMGAPDYDAYLAHHVERHALATPLTRAEFTRDALSRRYDRPGSRCC